MSILIDDFELNEKLAGFARAQPSRTTKAAMARAILQRAAQMTLPELERWLRDGQREASREATKRRGDEGARNAGGAEDRCA